MPIEFSFDHEKRLVRAKGQGTLTDEDVFSYQRDVWSLPEMAGYNELMDMSEVSQIALPSMERVRDLAKLSASMDVEKSGSKFAIVAPSDLAFGLGRMYEMYRDLQARSTKQVGVFRTLSAALEFLGLEGEPPKVKTGA
ncbi:MAG: hypothetical protein L0191_12630 [Acidobacteria bacterium]|nr:hypothetical protein [Acidobacteriota bacterium]MCI0657339.1 hypothetical protein [Acidobacteriota bacterium]